MSGRSPARLLKSLSARQQWLLLIGLTLALSAAFELARLPGALLSI